MGQADSSQAIGFKFVRAGMKLPPPAGLHPSADPAGTKYTLLQRNWAYLGQFTNQRFARHTRRSGHYYQWLDSGEARITTLSSDPNFNKSQYKCPSVKYLGYICRPGFHL